MNLVCDNDSHMYSISFIFLTTVQLCYINTHQLFLYIKHTFIKESLTQTFLFEQDRILNPPPSPSIHCFLERQNNFYIESLLFLKLRIL